MFCSIYINLETVYIVVNEIFIMGYIIFNQYLTPKPILLLCQLTIVIGMFIIGGKAGKYLWQLNHVCLLLYKKLGPGRTHP